MVMMIASPPCKCRLKGDIQQGNFMCFQNVRIEFIDKIDKQYYTIKRRKLSYLCANPVDMMDHCALSIIDLNSTMLPMIPCNFLSKSGALNTSLDNRPTHRRIDVVFSFPYSEPV